MSDTVTLELTDDQLVTKLADGIDAVREGMMTSAEFVSWVADVFDGRVEFARGSTPPSPRLRLVMSLAMPAPPVHEPVAHPQTPDRP